MSKSKKLDELHSSFGVDASTPDPVDVGNPHRPADQVGAVDTEPCNYGEDPKAGSEQPEVVDLPSPDTVPSSAEMLSDLIAGFGGMEHQELAGVYAQLATLGGIGLDPHTGRFADRFTGEDDERLAPVSEDVKEALADSGLNEDTVAKMVRIFDASVSNKVAEALAEAQIELEKKNQEYLAGVVESIEADNQAFMDHLAEEWLKENEVAVESNFRTAIAESFLAGLKDLFESHYITVPDSKVDVVECLADEVESLRAKLDEAKNELIKNESEATARQDAKVKIVESALADLKPAERSKAEALLEFVEFTDEDSFTSVVDQVVESVATGNVVTRGHADLLDEEVELDEDVVDSKHADPAIARVSKQLSHIVGNR
jgi:hypothetical protein